MPDSIEDIIARAIYVGRNGPGAKSWGRLPGRHQEPYLLDAKAMLAALDAAGFVIAPTEPTIEMVVAGEDSISAGHPTGYIAMLATRPKP